MTTRSDISGVTPPEPTRRAVLLGLGAALAVPVGIAAAGPATAQAPTAGVAANRVPAGEVDCLADLLQGATPEQRTDVLTGA